MPVVMVVDDSKTHRAALSRLLEREGYATIPANDGQDALSQLDFQHPDLIVTDLNMPGLDGLDLLEALQRHPDLKSIPVIMLTAQSDTHSVRRAEQLGAKEYMVKAAFSLGEMLRHVKKYTGEATTH
jgi:CheY-like chemotaxis protein